MSRMTHNKIRVVHDKESYFRLLFGKKMVPTDTKKDRKKRTNTKNQKMKKAKATWKTSSKQLTWKEVALKKDAAMKDARKEAHKSTKESYRQHRQNRRRLPSSKTHLRKVDNQLLYSTNKNSVATLKDDNDLKHKSDNLTDNEDDKYNPNNSTI